MRFSGNDIHSHQPAKTITSSNGEEEPFESLEELEAKTIGNLLPPEDNMFSGVTTELGHDAQNNNLDDLEDFDLFSSGGGMELEGEGGQGNSGLLGGVPNGQGDSNGSTVVGHPSRTLFVRNINSNVEDSELKAIFEVHIILHHAVLYLTFVLASPSSLSCKLSTFFFVLSAIWRYPNSLYSVQAPWLCNGFLL